MVKAADYNHRTVVVKRVPTPEEVGSPHLR